MLLPSIAGLFTELWIIALFTKHSPKRILLGMKRREGWIGDFWNLQKNGTERSKNGWNGNGKGGFFVESGRQRRNGWRVDEWRVTGLGRELSDVQLSLLWFVFVFWATPFASLTFAEADRANWYSRCDIVVFRIYAGWRTDSIVVDGQIEKEKQHNDEHNEQQLFRPHIQVYNGKDARFHRVESLSKILNERKTCFQTSKMNRHRNRFVSERGHTCQIEFPSPFDICSRQCSPACVVVIFRIRKVVVGHKSDFFFSTFDRDRVV